MQIAEQDNYRLLMRDSNLRVQDTVSFGNRSNYLCLHIPVAAGLCLYTVMPNAFRASVSAAA